MTAPRSQRHLLVRGGTLITMDPERRVVEADVLITDGRIAEVGRDFEVPPATRLLEAPGMTVLPGLIQGHVHLGQSLFRGMAEGRDLLSWLRDRIWPLEAAHTEESAYWSTLLGALDCLLSGTTTVNDIGLVCGMPGVFRGLEDSGLRAVAGKCLMDTGDGVPGNLVEETATALAEAEQSIEEWEGKARGRIRASVCPRFVLSCSRELWEGAVDLVHRHDVLLHTHLLESAAEQEEIKRILGTGQMEFLDSLGILDHSPCIAHGVLFGDAEAELLAGRRLGVVHCPSANAKLGSGIADVPLLLSREGISVGLGCDGAACNNDLDILEEMRVAALLQGIRSGPGKLDSRQVLEMATMGGARAIGMETEVGSLEPGKAGDLVVLDLNRPSSFAGEEVSLYDRIVYGTAREAVRWVVVDGEILVDNGEYPHLDPDRVLNRSREELETLISRAAI